MTIPILPVDLNDASVAFPADALDYMPKYEDIPEEFRNGTSPWCDFQQCWFAMGLSRRFSFQPYEGVDPAKAFRQLRAIQGSFAPKHEHKVAAVGYLASLWMESVIYGHPKCEDKNLKVLGEASLDMWLDYFADEDERAAVADADPKPHYELNDGTCVGCGKEWPCDRAYECSVCDYTSDEAGDTHTHPKENS